jgi:hypothetical protein
MRASMAYFAGVGTVVVAIAAGLGGGVILANVMNPNPSHQQTSRLEQRTSPQPQAASNEPDQAQQQSQAPVPYVAANQTAATPAVPEKNQPQPQTPVKPVQAGNSPPKAVTATPAPQPVAHEETAATDDAKDTNKDVTKTRDADSKRQADQRKNDRQRQWADRRKRDQQQRDQQQRDQDLRDAQARMQDDDGPRDVVVRRDDRRNWRDDRDARQDYVPPPTRFGAPAFGLFGSDD